MASVAAFVSSLVFNGVIALIILIIYSILRPKYDYVYQPNFKLLTEFLSNKISEKKLSLLRKMTLSSSFFAWIGPAFKLNDNELFELVGFDAFVYLRFIRLCFKIAAFSLPYAAVVLIPVNVLGGKDGVTGMDILTMGNVEQKSHKLWAHLAGVWLFSFLLYYLLNMEWQVYIKYRQIYLKEKLKQHYSVLVTQLPIELSQDEDLKTFVDKLFPDKVAHSYVIKDLEEWREMIQKHDQLVLKLEHAQAVFEEKGERPEHRLKPLCGKKVDSINHFDEELRGIQTELEKEHSSTFDVIRSAIITFKTLRDARIASQVLWQAKPYNTFVDPAPESTDIIWGNLKQSVLNKWIRWTIITTVLLLLVIFWMIPVGLVSALVSLESLQEKLPFLKDIVDELPTAVKGIIEGVLSTIALVIFFAILPMLLAFMSKTEGILSISDVTKSVIGKMFVFTIVNKFLALVLAGAFLKKISDIIDDPGSLPSLLAESLPAMSLFFLNFAMLQSLMGHALRLLRIGPLIVIHIKRKWLAKTPRELKNIWAPPCPNYGVMIPNDLFIFIIGVCYCVLSPIVIPFVMLYFGFGYIVHFYSMVYVMRPPFTSGGKMWPKTFNRMIVAILVFQILMIGVFGLKENAPVSALSVLPLVGTIIFNIFIGLYFKRVSTSMELDIEKEGEEEDAADEEFLQNAHNEYIAAEVFPPLFLLSTDDPPAAEEENKMKNSRGSSDTNLMDTPTKKKTDVHKKKSLFSYEARVALFKTWSENGFVPNCGNFRNYCLLNETF